MQSIYYNIGFDFLVFIFGAVLLLIGILGGKFTLFANKVEGKIYNPFIRFIVSVLGLFFVLLAIPLFFVLQENHCIPS